MPRFFDELDDFYGNGSKNEKGETLEEFLSGYDSSKYESPSQTVDILVVKEVESCNSNLGLSILMIQRRNHPCIGGWALPGGFVEMRESLNEAASRELEEETGLKEHHLTQLYTWGDVKRDPRARIITTSYLAYLSEDKEVQAGDDASDTAWAEIGFVLEKEGEYKLTLNNNEKGIHGEAIVKVTTSRENRIAQREFTLVKNQGIAFDHAKIIVQALLELE